MIDLLIGQPESTFIEDLKKPLHMEKPSHFGKRKPQADEIDMSGMYLVCEFSDHLELLETAFNDFYHFLDVYEIRGNRFPVTVVYGDTSCFEEYVLTISEGGAMIQAADTEGIRRGLIYLEDLIIESEYPALTPRCVTRTPVVKTRITRSFFSPTNRPPLNIDELYNDVDYYPDEYLNRIAHDGNNGVWIYTHFDELLKSDIIPEYGTHSQQRLEKLRKVVAKCARYGIKVYVFGVEPMGFKPELESAHPDMVGVPGWDRDRMTLCPRTEKGRAYCIESTQRLFEAVPGLGGYIDITAGERVTTCSSVGSYKRCPRCGRYSRGENLSYAVDLMREGMRRAGTDAEFISWTYGHREWDREDIREYVRTAPDDVSLMQNFGEVGYSEQLGKKRMTIDYWLSYVGPAEMFVQTAEEANKHHKKLYAKMQICNSHELGSVPYIPAPHLIFEKYREAFRYNVEGVLQCWYMGNYPSIMSKAAGELSFCSDFSDEDGFVEHLAGITYGKTYAKQVAAAWKLFARAYQNYPTNVMFSYYGPMHDGVVWELSLLPKNIQLPRSWCFLDDLRGDRIGEALQCGHTLEEAITLCSEICRLWKAGMDVLPWDAVGELGSVVRALDVLFSSGTNILKFYQLRSDLGYCRANATEILFRMENIVKEEMENSNKMITLFENDNRLGYHSEAGAFKFYTDRLTDRIGKLKNLLETEFVTVKNRIAEGKIPLGYYMGEGYEGYCLTRWEETASWEKIQDVGAFRVFYDDTNLYLDIDCPRDKLVAFSFEYTLLWPAAEMQLVNGKLDVEEWHRQHHSIFGDTLELERGKYTLITMPFGSRIIINRNRCGWTEWAALKLAIRMDGKSWKPDENRVVMLAKSNFSHNEFGWLIPISET